MKKQLAGEEPPGAAVPFPPVLEASHDQKPFRGRGEGARRKRQQLPAACAQAREPRPAKGVGVLPPSRVRSHDLKPRPTRPVPT